MDDLESLQEMFDNLGDEFRKKATRKALKAVGNLVKDALEEATPIRPDLPSGTALPVGKMKEDIRSRVYVSQDPDGNSKVTIGPGKETAHVADWVEHGHAMVVGGYSRVNAKGGRVGPGKVVGHVPAHPFIRPTQDAIEEEATEVFESVMVEEVTKATE